MISANNITLRVGKKALFEDVNIKFTEGNCYGLIGANGAGKSTFLKILSGQLEPTNGDIVITPGQRLSFLQQDHFKYDQHTVLDTVIMGNARLYEIMKEFVRIKGEARTAMVFISHDLGVIAEIADQVLVMNQGRVADRGTFREIMEHAQDPYTRLLVEKKRAVMARYREALVGRRMNLI